MKFKSNEQVDEVRLNSGEGDKQKILRKKKKTGIQKRKLVDKQFVKYVSSKNI